ncbi:MAG: hypothetical protein UX08_C0007G0004 [Candidatus Collierbacteria bacterium GW2011_GWB1_45_35]|uniref:Transposase IS200-like domain-containing protein n=2 Tax=Candidatus Collieribacteriota TaxID=1752725 RepID=A0A0G1MVX6_9BACT|nr:MAG: hypothetical protein UW48_C0001G0105 [Microgenomates group bacterium GW2011_GWC1_44_23]KKT84937.1 MAG: hypothetical protein UW84_C0044G0002 [Candidatus Collierbacteria bacterium GW2011_GWA2_44_99]KKT96225.1 MAG: hypothetical protein UW96_C0001G0103 [Candidatus Collierbacteria bacterium GW2011_GWA1_45_15]KKU01265.1 MAG: hypothetical protein UX01_C0001G0109 [Candidatus Collierbacteria bacterium GW2011_GWB2_45_17]KKU05307.1 MAG: hypothetical protein UX08_C0007G0004 [Candidatus Collierbacte
MPNIFPSRKSIRLPGYDYSQSGTYFVTICSYKHERIFGEIVNREMKLNELGYILEKEWIGLPQRFTNVDLNSFVIMPNHIHMIIKIVGVSFMKPYQNMKPETSIAKSKSNCHMGLINQTPTIGMMVRHFKSKCSYEIHHNGLNQIVWQRNYFEHIIRDDSDLIRIVEYIQTNPSNWEKDKLYIP